MDIKEAIRIVNQAPIWENDEVANALEVLMEVSEKQVAIPIFGDSDYSTKDNFLGRDVACSACGENVCYEYSNIEHFRFCSECGRYIDWEGVNK